MTGAATGTPRRRRAALLLAAAALLGSTACSDNPAPPPLEPDPSASTPIEPTGSPDAAPTLPPEARENTPAGAEAFVRYWVETLNYAGATGDVGPLRDASAPECAACEGIADGIERVEQSGGTIDGGAWIVTEVTAIPGIEGTVVDLSHDVTPQQVREDASAEPIRYRGGSSFKVCTLAFVQGGWQLLDLEEPS